MSNSIFLQRSAKTTHLVATSKFWEVFPMFAPPISPHPKHPITQPSSPSSQPLSRRATPLWWTPVWVILQSKASLDSLVLTPWESLFHSMPIGIHVVWSMVYLPIHGWLMFMINLYRFACLVVGKSSKHILQMVFFLNGDVHPTGSNP